MRYNSDGIVGIRDFPDVCMPVLSDALWIGSAKLAMARMTRTRALSQKSRKTRPSRKEKNRIATEARSMI